MSATQFFHTNSALLFDKKWGHTFRPLSLLFHLPHYLNIDTVFAILQQNSTIFALTDLFTRWHGILCSISLRILWWRLSVPPWLTYIRLQVLLLSQTLPAFASHVHYHLCLKLRQSFNFISASHLHYLSPLSVIIVLLLSCSCCANIA